MHGSCPTSRRPNLAPESQLRVAALADDAARAVRDEPPLAVTTLDEPVEINLDPAPTFVAVGSEAVAACVHGGERVKGDGFVLAGSGADRGHGPTVARAVCGHPV
jgi:hypothetical protein